MAEQFDEMLDAIAFVGDTLAPFFLEDPKTGGAQASFSAFAALDDYLCNHLLTWAPHYLEELASAARHPFYRGLAELTRSTLLGIQDFRGLSVKLPRFYK